MKKFCLAAAFFIGVGAMSSIPAVAEEKAFECAWHVAGDNTQAAEISSLLPEAGKLGDPAALASAVSLMREHNIAASLILDNLIAQYCPLVEKDAALSDAQRYARIKDFAARVAKVVYGGPNEEAVILDVPLNPDIAQAVQEKAAAAGVSPELWIAETVTNALEGGQ